MFVTSTKESLVTRRSADEPDRGDDRSSGLSPRFLAVGEGSVWTLNQGDGSISRVDLKTNKVVATIE